MVQFTTLQDRQEEQILAIHRETFEPLYGKHYESQLLKDELERAQVIVAEKLGRVVGFGSCSQVLNMPTMPDMMTNEDMWNDTLYWARHPELQCKLKETLDNKLNLNMKPVIGYYNVDFLNAVQAILTHDYNFNNMTVVKEYRNQGIGSEIVKRRIDIAQQSKANVILADCWMGGHSSSVLRKHGFKPMLLSGPSYLDGHASLSMALMLR